MSYVVYGFGNRESILDKFNNTEFMYYDEEYDEDRKNENKSFFIVGHACFSHYLEDRVVETKDRFGEAGVFYKFKANLELVQELIDWINTLYSNVSINIVGSKAYGKLFKYSLVETEERLFKNNERSPFKKRTKFADWDWNPKNPYYLISKNSFPDSSFDKESKKKALEELEGLDVSDILVEINVRENERFESKALLEMLLMVLLRTLDHSEYHFKFIKRDCEIIDDIIRAHDLVRTNHCFFDNFHLDTGGLKLNLDLVKASLDIKNISNVLDKNYIRLDFLRVTQTPLIIAINKYLQNKLIESERSEKE